METKIIPMPTGTFKEHQFPFDSHYTLHISKQSSYAERIRHKADKKEQG